MTQPSEYDFELPDELIAQAPMKQRGHSRLMVVTEQGTFDRSFSQLAHEIEQHMGTKVLLVMNNTQVIKARLYGEKERLASQANGDSPPAKIELLVCDPVSSEHRTQPLFSEVWKCLAKKKKSLRPGTRIRLRGVHPPSATVVADLDDGSILVRFEGSAQGGFLSEVERLGSLPLPPYIKRESGPSSFDEERYQTIFASQPGAVAAPTAGLHFTPTFIEQLQARGYLRTEITLHVGLGTFLPMTAERIGDHRMHKERYVITEQAAEMMHRSREEGYRILAVGTTVVRALESATRGGESTPRAGAFETDIFIYPPYKFRCVDGLITNFHLPRSTLLLLVAAFAGKSRVLSAYREAIEKKYRFFSYGDAMFLPCRMDSAGI